MKHSPASGRCREGVVVVFSLANLCNTDFEAFALAVAVWGQYCLTSDGSAASRRDLEGLEKWKNREKMRKISSESTGCENPNLGCAVVVWKEGFVASCTIK